MSMSSRITPEELARRLCDATNAHDLDGIVACFAADYRNETPVHPARGFSGREQVLRNWEQIFTFVPDLRAELLGCATNGHTVWTEWEHSGTRPDGSTHRMRGVIIFDVSDGLMSAARFYLEPVDAGEIDVDAAVRRQVNPAAAR